MKKGRLIHKSPFFIYNEMHKYLLNLEYESYKRTSSTVNL